jgi:hypothetical protein
MLVVVVAEVVVKVVEEEAAAGEMVVVDSLARRWQGLGRWGWQEVIKPSDRMARKTRDARIRACIIHGMI